MIKLALFISGIYIVMAAVFYFLQNKIFFFPAKIPQNYNYSFPYPFEEIMIDAHDGQKINGLYFKKNNPEGVILYFHGNAGSLAQWGWITEDFQPFNYDFLIIDFREYGKSQGPLNEQNLYKDAETWYQFLMKEFPEQKIILYGRSIGSGIAIDLAKGNKPGKLILESPFNNLPELAWHHFPVFPYRFILRYQFRSDRKAQHIKCPVFILHGDKDDVVPLKFGKKLANCFQDDQVNFTTIENGGHNDLNQFEAYHEALKKALEE